LIGGILGAGIDDSREQENRLRNRFSPPAKRRRGSDSPRTRSRKMRVHGNGPLYRKHGRYVRYHRADLVAWSEIGKRKSTSDVT
jgi:hypothetical protein